MPCKILIADPNLASYSDLQRLLHEQNHQVEIVTNGNQVLAKVLDFQPNIVLLAIVMPGKLGYQICDEIKSIPALKDIAVVLTFSENEPFDYLEARRVGASRYLPKSIEPSLLASILNFIWSGVVPIDSKIMSDNYFEIVSNEVNQVTLKKGVAQVSVVNGMGSEKDLEVVEEFDDLPDIDMDIEIESLDDMDEDDIQTIEVETDIGTDIEDDIINNEQKNIQEQLKVINKTQVIINERKEEIPSQLEYKFEVLEEKESIEEPINQVEEIPNLNIDSTSAVIELPGLEVESKPIFDTGDIKRGITNRLANIFESQITGEQFEYFPEDSEDPLQIKHSLNSIACQECGADVLPEDVFCIECGAAVDKTAVHVPESNSCNGCGQIVNLGDVFCLNCGMVQ